MGRRNPGIMQLQLGKNGLTDSFVEQVRKMFETEQILKISILKSACRDKAEAEKICQELEEKLGKNFSHRLIGYVCTINKFRRNLRE